MSTNPSAPGRHEGKRLSPWRVLLGILVALTITGAAAAVPWYLTERAPVESAPAGPHWFGGYFDVTAASVSETPTLGDGTDDTVVLSFIVAASADRCEPSWGAAYSLAQAGTELDLDRRIDGMRRDGARVAVSFGGALNTELATACTSTDELVTAYSAVVERYGITTVDLDIENANLADGVAGQRRAEAMATLQAEREDAGGRLDVWVTLPVATTGLTDDGLRAVRQLLESGVDLSGVNAMTMDYNTDLDGRTMGEAAIGALTAVHDQLTTLYDGLRVPLPRGGAWSVMGATPMIGQNDVPGEVFAIADARRLNEFAVERDLARLSMWSINRDRTCGPNYPDTTTVSDSCSGVDQGTTRYASILADGMDRATSDGDPTPAPPKIIPDGIETSPYPIWSPDAAYSADVRVVWHGYVYVAKWWVTGDPEPDDPTLTAAETAWVLVGPVVAEDEPFTLPTVPDGTYPVWDPTTVYPKESRVVIDGVPYHAEWWTQGDDPREGITDHDRSPWVVNEPEPSATPTPEPTP